MFEWLYADNYSENEVEATFTNVVDTIKNGTQTHDALCVPLSVLTNGLYIQISKLLLRLFVIYSTLLVLLEYVLSDTHLQTLRHQNSY